ncbi:unnamed protein product [Gordionus sp. m RMFG-2023]|uniref:transmembrane protein 245-like isoform X1 n=2 Tax=Gordionus sp. m RMFG-2023 TaxID=3053472 RepID=UPI0030DECAAD
MSGLYLGGLFYDINLHKTLYKESDSKNSVEIYNIPQLNVNTYQNINSDNMLTDKKNQNINVNNMIENEHKILNEIKNITDKSEQQAWDSNRYIMFLLWCCLFIEFYKWVLLILPLSILIAIIRRIGYHFGVWTIIYDRTYNSLSRCQNLKDNLKDFRLALINTPIKGVYELFLTLDRMIISSIRNSIDTATTVLLMFFTFITLLSLGIFLSFQIYQESAHLVNVVHSAVNSTIVENQWFQPSEQMEKSVDSVLESGYNAGREWIANQFTTLNQQNSNKDLSKLESQILILWDHVYDNMIKKGTMFKLSGGNKSSIMNKNLLVHNWQNIVESVTQLGSAHKDGIMKFVKENIDTLNSVLTTIWLIIKSNINLVFMISSNTLAFIFGGGTAILNFFLSWIIFLSTLVYFLSSSGEQYKPVQLFTQFMPGNEDNTEKTKQTIQIVDPNPDSKSASPSEEGQKEVSVISTTTVTTIKSKVPQKEAQDHSRKDHAKESPNEKDFDKSGSKETKGKEGGSTGANKIALAIQEAISGVFAATLKMATFYGLYTWLMHKIFGVGMVYIPTALASIFAAVPFVGTYVASLPATLELWILTGSYVIPLIFFALHLLPKFFVDATIYKEIKGGGHPYFTGLSIVGGIYMFGLEGALIGPMLLCCLFAGLKVFGAYMHEE